MPTIKKNDNSNYGYGFKQYVPKKPGYNINVPYANEDDSDNNSGRSKYIGNGDSFQSDKARDFGTGPKTKDYDQMARDVMNGKYGSGSKRKEALGDDYAEVQKRVNSMIAKKKANSNASTAKKLAEDANDGNNNIKVSTDGLGSDSTNDNDFIHRPNRAAGIQYIGDGPKDYEDQGFEQTNSNSTQDENEPKNSGYNYKQREGREVKRKGYYRADDKTVADVDVRKNGLNYNVYEDYDRNGGKASASFNNKHDAKKYGRKIYRAVEKEGQEEGDGMAQTSANRFLQRKVKKGNAQAYGCGGRLR